MAVILAAVGALPPDGAAAAEVAEQRLGGVGLAIPPALSFRKEGIATTRPAKDPIATAA